MSRNIDIVCPVQVRVLVNELRKQFDSRVGELADDLMAEPQHASGDPDALVFRVDQKLLPPAVRAASHYATHQLRAFGLWQHHAWMFIPF